ncbi:MAG TPA: hypothetical protein VF546_02220 [Pyrinomonadaceae bacterium]|jgi:regulator of replication initiation timing
MWRKLWEFITAAITLARDIEATRTDIKEIREELHQLALRVGQLQALLQAHERIETTLRELAVVQVKAQLEALAQHEQAEREKLLLQIRLEQKHLPPADEK